MALDKLAFIMALINKGNGTNGENVNLSDYYTKSQTDARIIEKIAEIVANAPDDFDTLKELSDWIANHEDSAATMNSAIAANTTAIAQKADKSTTYTKTETDNLLNNKVAKESGKGLSTNDFTNANKSKLDSLENYNDASVKADIAESASQAAINKSTLGYQRKNLLNNTAISKTVNGVTFTVNKDKTITVNGTATIATILDVFNISSDLVGKTLVLSGCPSNGNYQTGYALYATQTVSNNNTFGYDTGAGVKITPPENGCKVRIIVRTGATVNNLIFKPMLRYAEITDDTYEPYKPSVEERLAALEEKIAALEGGNT